DPKSQTFVKKRVVVTMGGAFPEGSALIQKLRALNNFFVSSRSSERIDRLKQVQQFHKLPVLAALVDVDVRVASTIKVFRRSIINYPAFQAFFQNTPSGDAGVFNCITRAECELAVQLEAVLYRVAELAPVESQSATVLSSTMFVLLRVASNRMNSYKFSACAIDGARDMDTNENNFPRVEIKLTDLSELAQRCIKRTFHQILERLEKPSTTMAMSLTLDPRTRPSAKNFSEFQMSRIRRPTISWMRQKHLCVSSNACSTRRSILTYSSKLKAVLLNRPVHLQAMETAAPTLKPNYYTVKKFHSLSKTATLRLS
ncbi:hypothetical protein L915_11233, partial [Phytophthora nicotianae]